MKTVEKTNAKKVVNAKTEVLTQYYELRINEIEISLIETWRGEKVTFPITKKGDLEFLKVNALIKDFEYQGKRGRYNITVNDKIYKCLLTRSGLKISKVLPNAKTEILKPVNEVEIKEPKKEKPLTVAKTQKRLTAIAEKVKNYDAKKSNSWETVGIAGYDFDLESASFGKKIEAFLKPLRIRLNALAQAKNGENYAKIDELTFKNVKAFKDKSEKYKNLDYVTTHQARLIVNAYIKSIDGNISRGERVEKQKIQSPQDVANSVK